MPTYLVVRSWTWQPRLFLMFLKLKYLLIRQCTMYIVRHYIEQLSSLLCTKICVVASFKTERLLWKINYSGFSWHPNE
jgi:hypothetical protein